MSRIRCHTKQMPPKTLLAVYCALLYSQMGYAVESLEYDSSFLMGDGATTIDVNRFTDGNPAPIGVYNVTVRINEQNVTNMSLPFIDVGKKSAEVCLTAKDLLQLHIKQPETTRLIILQKREDGTDCIDLPKTIEQSSVNYNTSGQQLDITVPQIWMDKSYSGYVPPELWDDGIPAALLSYSLNGYHSEQFNDSSDSLYGAFNTGLNLGAWRFRATGNYSWYSSGDGNFDYQNRYVQRSLAPLRSQLILGEAYTTGETFDSVSIRGARLFSDSRMLPSTLASYAPIIRGVANTNAKVTVTQNGYKIYETTVPPGAFALDDINPSGYGSELVVTVEEADGSKRTFTQPFSSVMQMQRPGVGRWDISAGQINDDTLRHEPGIIQGSFYYGINNLLTGYTGLQITDNDYTAGLLGVGLNTAVGAIALDITYSHADIPADKAYSGQSYRITWNKLLAPTNTSFNIAAYRYSTQNYLGLNDALRLIDDANHITDSAQRSTMGNYARLKNQVTLSVSQPLEFNKKSYGSLYLSGSWNDYWVTGESRSNYSVGYSNGASWGSYSLTAQRTWNEYGKKDDLLYVNFSIPLDNLFGSTARTGGFRTLNTQMNTDLDGNHQLNLSSSGYSDDDLFNYSVNTGYSLQKHSSDLANVGGYGSYRSPWGNISASASANNDHSRQYSLSTEGGFVAHSHGVTHTTDRFGGSDTIALVKASGAKGARINQSSSIDRWGYGATTALSPYRENQLSLDIETMEQDIELEKTSTMVVPSDGAVILSNFETNEGRAAFVNLVRSDNKMLPFAAEVYENGTALGNVGQGGQAFVRGINDAGELTVQWTENGQPASCRAPYELPENTATVGGSQMLLLNNVVCHLTKRD